jgi:hypothetical protein
MNKQLKQLIELDTRILNTSVYDLYNQSDISFLLDWQYSRSGGFNKALSKAISQADGPNLIKCFNAFEKQTLAIRSFQIKEGFWPFVQDRDQEVKKHLKLLKESVNA